MSLAVVLGEDARCTDPQDDSICMKVQNRATSRDQVNVCGFQEQGRCGLSLPSDKDVLKTTVAMAVYMCEYTKIY